MKDPFVFEQGHVPLIISIPHDGRLLAPGMRASMTEEALGLPDNDWYVCELYGFARELGASVLAAN